MDVAVPESVQSCFELPIQLFLAAASSRLVGWERFTDKCMELSKRNQMLSSTYPFPSTKSFQFINCSEANFYKIIISIQTLLFQDVFAYLTRQDGFQNRDKAYSGALSVCIEKKKKKTVVP